MDGLDNEIENVEMDNYVMDYVSKTQKDSIPEMKKVRLKIDYSQLSIRHKRAEYVSQIPECNGSPCVLFRTKFVNNTSLVQDYSLKTSRVTRSTCEVKMEKSLTISKEFNLKLSIPDSIAEAGAGYKREQVVTNNNGVTQQEEVTWAIDNNIKVPNGSFVVAKLRVMEHTYSSKFTCKTKIYGRIHVEIFNLQEKLIKKLSFLLCDAVDLDLKMGDGNCPFKMRKKGGWVTFESSGHSNYRYSIKQRVIINEGELATLKVVDVDSDSADDEKIPTHS